MTFFPLPLTPRRRFTSKMYRTILTYAEEAGLHVCAVSNGSFKHPVAQPKASFPLPGKSYCDPNGATWICTPQLATHLPGLSKNKVRIPHKCRILAHLPLLSTHHLHPAPKCFPATFSPHPSTPAPTHTNPRRDGSGMGKPVHILVPAIPTHLVAQSAIRLKGCNLRPKAFEATLVLVWTMP